MKKSKLIQLVLLSLAMILFQGCSDDNTLDDGSNTGAPGSTNPGSTTTSLSVSMTLKDGPALTDTDVLSITAVNPGYISVHVQDQDGNAAANKVVSISTSLAKATPSTVLTDASGNASATLEFLSSLGAGTVEVSTALDAATFTDSINYVVLAPPIQLGDNSGASFVSGQLEVSSATLSANGNTSIRAHLVDENEVLFDTPTAITFSSICSGLSTPLATLDKTVVTSSGIASSTYQAKGCVGDDIVTATAEIGGAVFTATGSLTVASQQAGSISFISATPQSITLLGGSGAGLQETSELLFQVFSSSGQALGGQSVTFTINGTAGGITFSPSTAVSDSNGKVRTVVQSGSIPSVVNIIATVDSNGIFTQSTGLVISAGLPDDDSFSLGSDKHNVEAWRYNGETVTVTAQLGDVYNNPPPAGTPVLFTTEGGSIGSKCFTNSAGRCSVTWSSGNPRPADFRSTVLAYTQGVESFADENADGYLSDDEVITTQLPEAFRDENENSVHDAGEFYADFDDDATYDDADNLYNGYLCNDSARCSSQTTLNISRSIVLVFSESFAKISATSETTTGGIITYADQAEDKINPLDIVDSAEDITVAFSDIHGQPLPVGTTINISSEVGNLAGTTSYTMKDTIRSGPTQIEFTISDSIKTNPDPSVPPDPEVNRSGRLTITVSTPKNNQTIIYFQVDE